MKKRVTVKIYKPIILFVALFFVVIIARLSYISLSTKVDDINLKEFASNRNTKTETIYAARGNIYDKNGEVLAHNINSYTLIAYLDPKRTTNSNKPQHVVDKAKTAEVLNEILGIDYNKALEILNKDAYQVEFGPKGKNIIESVKNKIEELKLPGIDFIAGQKRSYAMGAFASYIIGYAKTKDDGDIVGELGIESYYDEELSGIDGTKTYQTDAYGYTLPSASVIEEAAVNGDDIYLTIDTEIQLFAENLTRSLSNEYKELEWMIFAVMDAKTGAIVASSTYPNFDPNKLDMKSYMNPLISYEYEPGSTMKIFSFASAIEEGLYDGKEIYDSGSIKLTDGTTIRDFNKTGWGKIDFDTGFAYSSNVAATILGKRLKVEKLTDYYKSLGFGKKTGIELANEVNGKINFRYESELATASFGQGITVTPIQMLQALSTLTNDGTVLKPYVVEKIVNDKGDVIYQGSKTELNKVYSEETINYMHKLMHNVVYEGLSSSAYYQPTKVRMIGKTGTAQIASPSGGYLKGDYDYIRSFAGIFPEEDPQYIIYVATKHLNSKNAKPIALAVSKAVDDIVSSLGIVDISNSIEEKIINLNNYMSKEVLTTVEELKSKKLQVYVFGSGKYIINQYPLKNAKVLENSKIFLVSNSSDYQIPDLTGWSINEVTSLANLLGITININGYGYAVSQNIEPLTYVTEDMTLEVNFK